MTIAKANALSRIAGNEVWIIVTDDSGNGPVLPVDPRVRVIDLGVRYFDNDRPGIMYALKDALTKRRRHQQLMTAQLEKIQPDVVISVGTSEKYFLPFIRVKSKPSYIREIHFVRNYRIEHSSTRKERLFSRLVNLFDYGLLIRRYDRVVVLTEEDRSQNWHRRGKVVAIPNPQTQKPNRKSDYSSKTVVAVGRLIAIKNFSSLLKAWVDVNNSHPEWRLEIWGTGAMKQTLAQEVELLGISQSVMLKGFTSDSLHAMSEGSIFVLTSMSEGFPLVIVEAMSVGLPVVAYNCPYGPRAIIEDGMDGFLVETNDEYTLAAKICWLIEHEDERMQMGEAANQKASQYSSDVIAERWMKLFEKLKKR